MSNIDAVRRRSEGRCEAMREIPGGNRIYARCWQGPVEIHHMLTKARGGRILDDVGETYHLIALCSLCHRYADGSDAYIGSVLIDGYVVTENGRPVYYGEDEYLTKKYPRENQ